MALGYWNDDGDDDDDDVIFQSREEARKAAYDVLLRISSCLEDSSSADCDGPYYRLINMVGHYYSLNFLF